MTLPILLVLAVLGAGAGIGLLRYNPRKAARNGAVVATVGVVMIVCALSLIGIAIHVSTRPQQVSPVTKQA